MKAKGKADRYKFFAANKRDALVKHLRIGFKSTETEGEHHCKSYRKTWGNMGTPPGNHQALRDRSNQLKHALCV